MSVQAEIKRISGAKSDIATAITNKGVTVPSGTKLDGMAALIDSIESGGGGGGAQLETATLTIKTMYPETYEGFFQIVATRYVNGAIEPYIFFRNHFIANDPIRETVIDNVLLNSPIYCLASASSGIQDFSTNGIGGVKIGAGHLTGKIIASEASVTQINIG